MCQLGSTVTYMTSTERPAYVLKGVNDEADTCTACGRRNLKRVAWLAELDEDGNEGEVAAYGTDCAGKLLHGAKNTKNTSLVRAHGEAMDAARRWLAAGHEPAKVSDGVWNRYGYSTDPRPEGVWFSFGGVRTLVAAP